MRRITLLLLLAGLLAFSACGTQQNVAELIPPTAEIKPMELSAHSDVRVDNYYWLNERENPEVIAYLNAENEYTNEMMSHTADLQSTLFEELKGRLKPNDESVPVFENGYLYYTRYEEGQEYAIYCRKEGSLEAAEEVLLNVNEMVGDNNFFSVSGVRVSPNNKLLAYNVDNIGRRKYTLHFRNLETGENMAETITNISGSAVWANDNNTVFYTRKDPDTLRAYQIYRQAIGGEAELVFQEDDEIFECRVWKTKSKQYVMISTNQTLSNEHLYLNADQPNGEFQIIQARERGLEYRVDHFGDDFYILTNMDAFNFRLMKTPVNASAKENWTEFIAHREDTLLEGFKMFSNFLVVSERGNAQQNLRIIPWDGSSEHYIEFPEEVSTARVSSNPEFNTDTLRFNYSSMLTPNSVFDYNMATHEKELMKQDEVIGYDASQYTSKRLWATARDGAQVPVSILYKTDMLKNDGSNPGYIYAYGSYGSSRNPSFNSSILSMLDRGFVYALAHIRGGQEMGRMWYEDGKLLNKINTFTDFNDVAHFLINEKYTASDKLFAEGGSAGGLLMGAIVNLEPELYKGVLAHVPFVDVVTTMLDATIPLTTFEWDEWGDPRQKEYYDYMLSYSPYDQVEAKAYPNLLVTTSLHDSQVQYWEPAKWVAKLRTMKTDENILILKTNMEGGHGGTTGRFKRLYDKAFNYAFILDLLK